MNFQYRHYGKGTKSADWKVVRCYIRMVWTRYMIQQGFARLEVESLSSGKVHVLYPEDAEITYPIP